MILPFLHAHLIDTMQKFDYNPNLNGICFGIGYIGTLALVSGYLDKFNQLLQCESSLPPKTCNPELDWFFTAIQTAQSSQFHLKALKKISLPLFSKFENQQQFVWLNQFSGAYTKNDLIDYLHSFVSSISDLNLQHPVALFLTNSNHTMSIGFNAGEDIWYFINSEHLPIQSMFKDNTEELAKLVLEALSKNIYAIFTTQVCGAKVDQNNLKKLIATWQENDRWKKIHTVTTKKSSRIDSEKSSWLYIAAKHGHFKITKSLLEQGAAFNYATNKGINALLAATGCGHYLIVKALLKAGSNDQHITNDGNTALILAAASGNLKLLHLFLKPDNINESNHQGITPLMAASMLNRLAVVRRLLELGASVNQPAQDGSTALYLAAQNAQIKIVQLLLTYHALVNQGNQTSLTPLMVAAANSIQVAQLLLNHGANPHSLLADGSNALCIAARAGNIPMAKFFLTKGLNVNHSNQLGWTALFFAAENGHEECFQFLIAAGGDLTWTAHDGTNLLIIAAKNQHESIVRFLLDKGTSVNHPGLYGGTSLHWTAQNGHLSITELLLQQQADINSEVMASRKVLLAKAKENVRENIFNILFQCYQIGDLIPGFTPLHLAVLSQREKIIHLLLAQGAKLIHAKQPMSVFDLAFALGFENIYEVLYKHLSFEEKVYEDRKMVLRKILAAFENTYWVTQNTHDLQQHLSKPAASVLYQWAKQCLGNPTFLQQQAGQAIVRKLFEKPRTKHYGFFVEHLKKQERATLGFIGCEEFDLI